MCIPVLAFYFLPHFVVRFAPMGTYQRAQFALLLTINDCVAPKTVFHSFELMLSAFDRLMVLQILRKSMTVHQRDKKSCIYRFWLFTFCHILWSGLHRWGLTKGPSLHFLQPSTTVSHLKLSSTHLN